MCYPTTIIQQVPKDVVMGSMGEPRIVGTRGSCSGHVGEGSKAFVVSDSHFGCVAVDVVNGGQVRNINQAGLCSAANVVDNVNPTFDVQGFCRMVHTEISGTSLNETRKRSRDTMTTCGNVDGSALLMCMSNENNLMHEPGHVGEGSQPFVVSDSQLGCLTAGVVNGGQDGNINQASLCSIAYVVDNFNPTFDVPGFSTLLNETRKRSRDTTTACGNVDGNGCSSRRQRMSVDHGNPYLTAADTDFVRAGGPLPNTRNSSHVHVSGENNPIHESEGAQRMSFDYDNPYLTATKADFVLAGGHWKLFSCAYV
uniref:Uncharacterized protein n=1 Tax=Tanacetum cinerariifolium TaxID=118510 RepID=A0A6L2MSM1_TANCI|nr:hypothetical protein [Tanacetum cinerariifolium]